MGLTVVQRASRVMGLGLSFAIMILGCLQGTSWQQPGLFSIAPRCRTRSSSSVRSGCLGQGDHGKENGKPRSL